MTEVERTYQGTTATLSIADTRRAWEDVRRAAQVVREGPPPRSGFGWADAVMAAAMAIPTFDWVADAVTDPGVLSPLRVAVLG